MSTVVDVTDATFKEAVLDRSHEVPIVVDFWAGWCGPCRALGPVLEKLADEADGAWELAKLDVDANPMVAQGFRIQGIPAVKAFKDGKLVAEFTGALPEPQVRAWLSNLGPTPADIAFDRGRELEASGDLEGASAAYESAVASDPGHKAATMALARVRVRLRAGGEDIEALRAKVQADPLDVDAAISLADRLLASGDARAAFAPLLHIVARGDAEPKERARAHLVELFATLPPDDLDATEARRTLSRALF